MQNKKIDHVSSYYAATINEAINYPELKEDISSEVCIVGRAIVVAPKFIYYLAVPMLESYLFGL